MIGKSILFVSTVREWGGSEVLWVEAALSLADKGFNLKFAVRYSHPTIQRLRGKATSFIDLSKADSPLLPNRILRKAKLMRHPFLQALLKHKPQLVVINLSNNVHGEYYLTTCRELGVPYVTLINLVPIILWAFMYDEGINKLRAAYAQSKMNYFVSQANLNQHNIMIGDENPNSKVILNPITVHANTPMDYPPIIDGQYQIALVGRLETFHKGQDLLLQVLHQSKWKNRPVTFNIYGSGPHLELLERLVKKFEIMNVVFKGYLQGVAQVWKTNHLLLLPSRMEGQSLALIEAMWCHRGAVVTDVGGARELITDGETGFIAANPSVADIDNALEKAWTERYRWDEIGRNAGKKIREIYKCDPVASFTQEIQRVFDQVSAI
jgi:glycosyltransferase involved in cell wall biosynthesis